MTFGPRAARPPGDSRSDVLFGAILFVVALAPRLWVALALAGEPVWDGHYYDFGARRISEGHGYSDDLPLDGLSSWHPWCHYPVGYSAFLSVFYRALGPSHATAAVANALVGAALAVVTWALGRLAMTSGRARAAGVIVALSPGLVLYSALVMSEPLAALLTLTAFWLAARDASPRRGLALGALGLGVAALVRPQALLCAPFLALVLRSDRSSGLARGRLLAATAACAIALVPVLPWTARNCAVMDGCALVSTNTGWNLAIGAFPRATGRFETLRSSDGCREVTGQVQQDRCWLAYGVAQIEAHPWRWLALIPKKLGFTFDHESFAVEYLHEARPDAWPEGLRAQARDATTLLHRLLLVASMLGCLAFPSSLRGVGARAQAAGLGVAGCLVALALAGDSPAFWPAALFAAVVPWLPLAGRPAWPPALLLPAALLGTTLVTHAIFFGEDRYHVVTTPVLALLAAAALRPGAPGRAAVARVC